jgi:hypothetical protein
VNTIRHFLQVSNTNSLPGRLEPAAPPYVGHWPATATCPPEGPPCNQVTNPAVMPGEGTDIFWTAWAHGDEEPNGLYVFRYTVHGTLNGTPVEVSGNSPPIRMTE